jgi:hypothetical protein
MSFLSGQLAIAMVWWMVPVAAMIAGFLFPS